MIVSGKIYLHVGKRDEFLASSLAAVKAARKALGCRDFVVAADPLEPERVNIYEEWDSEADLLVFRGDGPDQSLSSLIADAAVYRHEISSSEPA